MPSGAQKQVSESLRFTAISLAMHFSRALIMALHLSPHLAFGCDDDRMYLRLEGQPESAPEEAEGDLREPCPTLSAFYWLVYDALRAWIVTCFTPPRWTSQTLRNARRRRCIGRKASHLSTSGRATGRVYYTGEWLPLV